jgi:hypothetical protein
MTIRLATVCLGTLLLGGCASGTAIQGWGDGHLPERSQAYHIKVDASGPGARADAISAVRNALLSKGWREANEPDSWSVEVTYSVRPMVVGAFSDESARKEMWELPPSIPYFWTRDRDVHVLNLALARPQDGIHDISVGAAKRARRPAEQSILQDLARTAVSRLSGAPL